jgi:hypothetical protein
MLVVERQRGGLPKGERAARETEIMPTILSDHDVEGQLEVLLSIWTAPNCIEVWQGLDCHVATFGSLGIRHDLPDSELWQYCQSSQFILLTGNRNADSDDSLERTSAQLNQPDSLPVLTIANAKRVAHDRQYAERVANAVLDFIVRLDELRGTRRLYVP